MDINIEVLINEIFLRPVLWDQKNKQYHNRYTVEKQWESVSAAMKQPKDILKKKWKIIRDQFRSEYKKIPVAKSGDAGISETQIEMYTTWTHFKSLLFLKDQMRPRKMTGNLKAAYTETPIFESDTSIQENLENTLCSSPENEYTGFEVVTDKQVKQKSKRVRSGASQMLDIEKRKLELLEKKMDRQHERDDDDAFFQSLLPFMKKMDLNQKLRCRIDVQNIVYNYAFASSGNLTLNVDHNSQFSHCTSHSNSSSEYTTPASSHPSKYVVLTSPTSPEPQQQVGIEAVNQPVVFERAPVELPHFATHF